MHVYCGLWVSCMTLYKCAPAVHVLLLLFVVIDNFPFSKQENLFLFQDSFATFSARRTISCSLYMLFSSWCNAAVRSLCPTLINWLSAMEWCTCNVTTYTIHMSLKYINIWTLNPMEGNRTQMTYIVYINPCPLYTASIRLVEDLSLCS